MSVPLILPVWLSKVLVQVVCGEYTHWYTYLLFYSGVSKEIRLASSPRRAAGSKNQFRAIIVAKFPAITCASCLSNFTVDSSAMSIVVVPLKSFMISTLKELDFSRP
jgi:hypothetical protein